LVSLPAIALGTRADAVRALWHVVGFGMVYVIAWWALTRTVSPAARLLCLAAVAAVCVPAAWAKLPPTVAKSQRMQNSDSESDLLWSFGFQHSTQRIGRAQPLVGAVEGYEVHVRLAAPYAGPARLFAAVNGVEVGQLSWPADEDTDQIEAVAAVPAAVLSGLNTRPPQARPALALPLTRRLDDADRIAHIVVWADRASSDLRIVAQRALGGTTLGQENSWFYSGERWYAGVLHAATGTVRPGLWHVFLARGHVGR